jgi:hypothetical protein
MASEADVAQRLIERLLSDPAFRADFRRDPAATAREAGLAGDMLVGGRDPLQTLDVRESRSSLAGVLMAAAVEGIAISQIDVADAFAHSAGTHERIDPDQYGMEGGGGRPSAEALALLRNDNVTFDAEGVADLKAGRIDPRAVSLLDTLSRDHRLTISATCSDHPS